MNNDNASHLNDQTSRDVMTIMNFVSDDVTHSLKAMSEEQKLKEVREIPLNIAYIDNPSEELQMAAIEANPDCYRFIEHPTHAVSEKARDLIFAKRIES